MATRTVSVRLVADVGQYVGALGRAGAATTGLTGALTRGFSGAGMGALALGGAVTAGLGMAVSKSMEFEKAMSAVAAATGESAAALGDLREAAMKAGADTQYSATEAANAITEMAKAGVSSADIMGGGLAGALALAAAGQMDVADAAGIASVAMTQFRLSGEDLPHVADLLAAGAGKAMGSVDDLGAALNQAGLVASSAGLSIEETTGTLAAFASAGLIGSDAGTSLKTMLQRLQNPSAEAAGVMSDLGISMYDANGQFVGMESLAGQLAAGMGDLTPQARDAALAVIFGSDAVRAANVLYAEGASGIAGWTDAVDDAGYAQEQAAALTDNLSGDLERLGGAWDTLLISLGEGTQGPLRGLVQGLTGLLDVVGSAITWFSDLPGPVLLGVGAMTALMLINGPLAGAIGTSALALSGWYGRAVTAAGGAGLASVAMAGLRGVMASTMALMGGPLGLAVIGVTVGIGFLASAIGGSGDDAEDAADKYQTLAGAIKQTGGAIDDTVRRAAAQDLLSNGVLDAAEDWGVASNIMVEAALGNEEAMDDVTAAALRYEEAQRAAAGGIADSTTAEGVAIAASQAHRQALEDAATTTEGSIADARTLASALEETADSTTVAAAATGGLTDSMALLGDTTGWTEEQIADAQKALQDWRDNAQSILESFVEPVGIYSQLMQDAAQATADSTESSEDSWSDYVDSTTVSLDQYAAVLEEQILAQENWRTNIVLATQRGGQEVGDILFQMGEEGAGLVQQMVDASDEDFIRLRDLLIRNAHDGGAGAATQLQQQMAVMAAVGAQGASATVQGIAAQLGLGVDVVRGIAAQYGINLAEGVNPILAAVGQPTMNLLQFNGPYRARGGPITGPGTGTSDSILAAVSDGEYVVRAASVSKYGMDFLDAVNQGLLPAFATGGFVSVAAIPRPPAPGASRPPVSTAATGTMNKGYNAVAAWLPSVLEPPAASGGSSTGLIPIMAAARQYVMDTYGIRNIGGFAKRNIIGTNTPSDHSMGKAIDIMTTNLGLGWQIANDFAYGPAHAKYRAENVIWQQSISSNGGRFVGMADRGSPTQNHRDHVHVDTYDSGGLFPSGTLGVNMSGRPEAVLTFEQWQALQKFADATGNWHETTADAVSDGISNGMGDAESGISAAVYDGMVLASDGSWIPAEFFTGITNAVRAGMPAPTLAAAAPAPPRMTLNDHGATVPFERLMEAARELLGRMESGGRVFEDMSFAGMSRNLADFNDTLTLLGHSRGNSIDWLRGAVRTGTFDSGGILRPGYTLAYNGTGQNERVLTGREWSGVAMSGASGGSSRTVQYGDIHVTTNPDETRIARVVERVLREREVLTSPWTG